MSPEMKARLESCVTSEAGQRYLGSLRPATDLLIGEVADSGEVDTLRSLEVMACSDDPDVTARLPMLDIESLSAEVRVNLGGTAEDGSQAVACSKRLGDVA